MNNTIIIGGDAHEQSAPLDSEMCSLRIPMASTH